MNSILEQLEINHTFLYQFVAFIAFYIVLSQLYLKPFQKLIEKRNAKLKDDVETSNELLKAIDVKMGDYQKALAQARTEARQHSEKIIADARAKEDAAVAALKEEIKHDYQKAAQQLQEDRKRVEAELQGQVEQMADQLVAKIKGA
jgi:F-type H+-transporting ATPase subunit b